MAAVGCLAKVAMACALLIGGAARAQTPPALTIPGAALEPVGWNDLNAWPLDDRAAAFRAFLASCRGMPKNPNTPNPKTLTLNTLTLKTARNPQTRSVKTPNPQTATPNTPKGAADPRPMAAALRTVCARAQAAGALNSERAGGFFEANFRPVQIAKLGETRGFLTGYYEPIVDGSRLPTPIFHTALYRRPDDLVVLGAAPASDGFPNKAAVGRKVGDRVVPGYFDRGDIEDGALDGRHLEICWIKDPIDALIIQIQGSARVRLEDGLIVRINYDAHNGWPYTAIGRLLIERNIIPKEEMSLERLRAWMQANPDAAAEVRRSNRSFVFFRITGLGSEEEPIGGQGVRLTPGRSIAVDNALHVYGTPFFIEAELPAPRNRTSVPFRHLMIAQDTGSAIVGPARADLYFGAGEDAGHLAGRIRQTGRFVMLVPREIDPASARPPLPRPRPVLKIKARKTSVHDARRAQTHRHTGQPSGQVRRSRAP